MEAVGVNRHVVSLRGMKLQNGFVLSPEEALDEAHLIPVRATVGEGHANVLPSVVLVIGTNDRITGDDFQLEGLSRDVKDAERIAGLGLPLANVVSPFF
jgi:hypothetical protein